MLREPGRQGLKAPERSPVVSWTGNLLGPSFSGWWCVWGNKAGSLLEEPSMQAMLLSWNQLSELCCLLHLK